MDYAYDLRHGHHPGGRLARAGQPCTIGRSARSRSPIPLCGAVLRCDRGGTGWLLCPGVVSATAAYLQRHASHDDTDSTVAKRPSTPAPAKARERPRRDLIRDALVRGVDLDRIIAEHGLPEDEAGQEIAAIIAANRRVATKTALYDEAMREARLDRALEVAMDELEAEQSDRRMSGVAAICRIESARVEMRVGARRAAAMDREIDAQQQQSGKVQLHRFVRAAFGLEPRRGSHDAE